MIERDEREPGNINGSRLSDLHELIKKYNVSPKRLFIVGKNMHLIIHGRDIEIKMTHEDYGLIIPSSFGRGSILDSFSKIEFFINELIRAKIFGKSEDPQYDLLDTIIDKVDFYTKFRMLADDFNLLNKNDDLYKKVMIIKDVRNALAHVWNIDKIYYKNQSKGSLESNFGEFKEDLRFIWKELIKVYERIINQNFLIETNINSILSYVESKNLKESIRVSEEEYDKLLEKATMNYKNESGERRENYFGYMVGIALAGGSGLKTKEILSLKKSQIKKGVIHLDSGERIRSVPIPPYLNETMIEEAIPFKATIKRSLEKAVQKMGLKVTNKEINLGSLRGYFVYKSFKEGMSASEIAKLLGLENLGSLETYISRIPLNLLDFSK